MPKNHKIIHVKNFEYIDKVIEYAIKMSFSM